MADKPEEIKGKPEGGNHAEPTDSLEDFVTKHYKQQKDEGKFDNTQEIDEERTNNFFSRAIAESRRMNAEVAKSEEKSSKLAEEFGKDTMNAWQAEHAAEVLLPAQQELLSLQ